MGSLNKVQVIGNLGADPETKYLPSGDAVTNLSLATTDKWKDKKTGEQQERTEWHRISFFGRAAEVIAEYCQKGSSLYVEGSLQTRKWQDNDGNDRYTTEIKGQNFQLLGGRNDGGQSATGQSRTDGDGQQQEREPDKQSSSKFDDDIPF